MIHRPGISCFPIRSVHTASPFSSWVRHDASPIGMNLSSASRTPIDPGTSPYRILHLWLMWAKYRFMRFTHRSHVSPVLLWPFDRTSRGSTDRTTTRRVGPAARSAPIYANPRKSIPGDARSLPRSAYTSGALRAWADVLWFLSRTHQHEPDGAIGSNVDRLPAPIGWRSQGGGLLLPSEYRFTIFIGVSRALFIMHAHDLM